jgi:transposase
MKRRYFIGLDVHCPFCELAVVTQSGRLSNRFHCDTTIPDLVAAISEVPRPRSLTFEEGPMADWLCRNLRPPVDELVVCEPRRNHLIANDSDKDDPIDAEKLAQLLRGGYLKAVHHPESLEQLAFKQHVMLYHDRVRARVREVNHISGFLRRHGIFVGETGFAKSEARSLLLQRLPPYDLLRDALLTLLQNYDLLVEQEHQAKCRLEQRSRKEDVIKRWCELPGVGWVRAATLFVALDTPWRFPSKEALWRYLGIGLERRRSGNGPMKVRVPKQVNRLLKTMILGAAMKAISLSDNPFADQHRRWLKQGVSPGNARRNVARSQSAVMWGMWKNGNVYHPEWVGVSMAAQAASLVSA